MPLKAGTFITCLSNAAVSSQHSGHLAPSKSCTLTFGGAPQVAALVARKSNTMLDLISIRTLCLPLCVCFLSFHG